jgi:hypothetical protein
MTLMPEIHDALARAVATRSPRRRWWHPSRRAGLLAIGAVIVSGTAMAATTGWQPILGSPDRGTPPLAANAGVPADQLAALAILRRAQTDADRGPLVRRALRLLSRQMINGIHTDAIRVIFHGPRELAVLVPAERVGRYVKGVPSSKTIRRHALCLMSTSYQDARTWKITQHGKPKTIHVPAGYNAWGFTCGALDMLRTSGIQTGTSPDASGGLIVNGLPRRPTIRRVTLVPDGVARVTVRLRHGRSITVPVRDNVYRYTIHEFPASMGTIWFDAAGQRIDHRKRP